MLVKPNAMDSLERFAYYRIIPVGGHSRAVLLEYHDPHKSVLKALISARGVRRGQQLWVSLPLQMSRWFAQHPELRPFLPQRVLTVLFFNITSPKDIDTIMNIVKALYGFVSPEDVYHMGVKPGRIKPASSGMDEHYRLFLNANTETTISPDELYELLRKASRETEASTP